jgi:hypothetical protein
MGDMTVGVPVYPEPAVSTTAVTLPVAKFVINLILPTDVGVLPDAGVTFTIVSVVVIPNEVSRTYLVELVEFEVKQLVLKVNSYPLLFTAKLPILLLQEVAVSNFNKRPFTPALNFCTSELSVLFRVTVSKYKELYKCK